MAKKKYEETYIANIADAIRRCGSPENYDTKYTTEEMESAIANNVGGYNFNKGYEEGEEVGWTTGYADGSTEGYKVGRTEGEIVGKQTASDEFWDSIQNYGERTTYARTFEQWGGEYFRPKYKIVPTSYYDTNYGMYKFINACPNLKKIEKAYLDFSQVGLPTGSSGIGWRQTFQNCKKLEVVEDIGMQPAVYYYAFNGCYQLHTIEVLRFAEDTRDNSGFLDCSSLKNITIEGTIGQNLSFKSCPLSAASLKSVITHLKDYTGTTSEYTYKLTLKSSAFATLEAEGATAEYNGTLCTWRELIDNKKWNLTLA